MIAWWRSAWRALSISGTSPLRPRQSAHRSSRAARAAADVADISSAPRWRRSSSSATCTKRRWSDDRAPSASEPGTPAAIARAAPRDEAAATAIGSAPARTSPAIRCRLPPRTRPAAFRRPGPPDVPQASSRDETAAAAFPRRVRASCSTRSKPCARRPSRLRTAPRGAPGTTARSGPASGTTERPRIRSSHARPPRLSSWPPRSRSLGSAGGTRPSLASISTRQAAPYRRASAAASCAHGPDRSAARPGANALSSPSAPRASSRHRARWRASRSPASVRRGDSAGTGAPRFRQSASRRSAHRPTRTGSHRTVSSAACRNGDRSIECAISTIGPGPRAAATISDACVTCPRATARGVPTKSARASRAADAVTPSGSASAPAGTGGTATRDERPANSGAPPSAPWTSRTTSFRAASTSARNCSRAASTALFGGPAGATSSCPEREPASIR